MQQDYTYSYLQYLVNEFRNLISAPEGNNFNSVLFGGIYALEAFSNHLV